jgi:hypothetical protein
MIFLLKIYPKINTIISPLNKTLTYHMVIIINLKEKEVKHHYVLVLEDHLLSYLNNHLKLKLLSPLH